jgi:uncharacterized membrane protein
MNVLAEIMRETMRRPHPAVVHFPITLYPLSLVFLIIFWAVDNPFFLHASFWSLTFGVITTIFAAMAGWHDYNRVKAERGRESNLLNLHMASGITITAISILALVIFLWQPPMNNAAQIPLYTFFVILLTALIIVQGAVGGLMVYGYRIGVKREEAR